MFYGVFLLADVFQEVRKVVVEFRVVRQNCEVGSENMEVLTIAP